MRLSGRLLLAAALFAVSAFMLAGKLMSPSRIQVVIEGGEPIVIEELLSYTLFDVVVVAASAFLLGISGLYLLSYGSAEQRAVPAAGAAGAPEFSTGLILRLLDADKRNVLKAVIDSGGEMLQSELPARTGFSRAKITRILDDLEGKGLVVRRRHGMTNVVMVSEELRRAIARGA